jgi:hypothetical protein
MGSCQPIEQQPYRVVVHLAHGSPSQRDHSGWGQANDAIGLSATQLTARSSATRPLLKLVTQGTTCAIRRARMTECHSPTSSWS